MLKVAYIRTPETFDEKVDALARLLVKKHIKRMHKTKAHVSIVPVKLPDSTLTETPERRDSA